MVYGKRNRLQAQLKAAVGIMGNGKVMAAPESACKKHCNIFAIVKPGNAKKSDVAKKIQKYLSAKSNQKVELDDIMSVMPPGDCSVQF